MGTIPRQPGRPPTVIVAQSCVERLARDLVGQPVLGLDTESNSFHAYRPRLCLLQLSTASEDFLIDPLAELDLSPLDAITANPGVVKVFHDAEQDIPLLREHGIAIAGLADTKVICMALRCESQGLAGLVERYLGEYLDKTNQRSDWGRRPLQPQQIVYARNDTRYLIPLYDRLLNELQTRGDLVGRLVRAELRRLEAVVAAERTPVRWPFLNVKGARHLSPPAMGRLAELFAARDLWAQKADQPPAKAFPNAGLLGLALWDCGRINTMNEMQRASGLTPRLLGRHRRWIAEALDRAAERGPLYIPPDDLRPESQGSPGDRAALSRLLRWRRSEAERLGIDACLVIRRRVLAQVVTAGVRDLGALGEVMGVEEWWLQVFGLSLVRALLGDRV